MIIATTEGYWLSLSRSNQLPPSAVCCCSGFVGSEVCAIWSILDLVYLSCFTALCYIYIYAFSRRFQATHFFLSVCVFPGNWTHNLCAANAMLYHWATGICWNKISHVCVLKMWGGAVELAAMSWKGVQLSRSQILYTSVSVLRWLIGSPVCVCVCVCVLPLESFSKFS